MMMHFGISFCHHRWFPIKIAECFIIWRQLSSDFVWWQSVQQNIWIVNFINKHLVNVIINHFTTFVLWLSLLVLKCFSFVVQNCLIAFIRCDEYEYVNYWLTVCLFIRFYYECEFLNNGTNSMVMRNFVGFLLSVLTPLADEDGSNCPIGDTL